MEEDNYRRSEESNPKEPIILGSRNTDVLGRTDWKDYLRGLKLADAWSLPDDSPYKSFVKTKAMLSIDNVARMLKPRFLSLDEITYEGMQRMAGSGVVDNNTCLVLDSGGAHSVAMAAVLAEKGFQPVVMFDNVTDAKGSTATIQDVAVLMYFARFNEELKLNQIIRNDFPPVFILDAHRHDKPFSMMPVDTSYQYKFRDFPSGEILVNNNIKRMIYLTETDLDGKIQEIGVGESIDKDLRETLTDWQNNGIKLFYTGISPKTDQEKELKKFLDSNRSKRRGKF